MFTQRHLKASMVLHSESHLSSNLYLLINTCKFYGKKISEKMTNPQNITRMFRVCTRTFIQPASQDDRPHNLESSVLELTFLNRGQMKDIRPENSLLILQLFALPSQPVQGNHHTSLSKTLLWSCYSLLPIC